MADFEVNRRLKYLIKEIYKTTPFDFSKRYDDMGGVKTSAIMRNRNGVSNKMLDTICAAYPEINRTWLLTGEGQMLNNFQNENSGTIVNNDGDGNFFTQNPNYCALLEEKDRRIEELKKQVEFLQDIIKAGRKDDAER